MGNVFCTLALGQEHAGYARFLADDLGDYGQAMAIVTDMVNFQGGAHMLADAGGTKTGLTGGYTVSMIQ